ncbi:DUF2062 domain-containing protein [Novosphingobium sp. FSW06-99]|uniref:DUF2062 domain-containing protein n=1 Tax=Novosphingobium sp. FSW06-99 TaxID=1739113 RepID=UPI000ADFE340|nr:DUF2062 domain-containing protein [Novosphingobium sp. FSW06-99]
MNRLLAWAHARMPTRESLARNRLIAPLAARPELWRFTRRTVPRGVAIGLFIGIFLMVPGLQVIGAVLVCVPLRANIPIAAVSTFIAIPPTILLVILPGAAAIGNRFGYHADLSVITAMVERGASTAEWLAWVRSDAAPALAIGLTLMAIVVAALGYAVAACVWRWRVMARRRRRLHVRGGA